MGSLYWQHSQMMGLNVTSPDYLNIHTWLDPMSPIYKAELADAIQAGQQKMNIWNIFRQLQAIQLPK
jgi:hypothetical protein